MKIVIDIGHPGHVHYFKNFIKIMENKNHQFLLFTRDKEVTHNLLNNYKIMRTVSSYSYQNIIKQILKIYSIQFQKTFVVSINNTIVFFLHS